ncbi:p24 [Agapanthus tungrovirus]|uniref:p24 n=1 Tax=Agapanthus tungrovirus TaxID=2838078 RepID=A0A8E7NEI5_9VIRU|nr:p24 [Agapanthus tungrovirus]QVY19150.1 p24 [Agapanthus tungrovirus]QVY19154.1 p24 [Agapanthus tungrovirus]QVY19162.1 p24 [Agapanthus tungrovirus]QVY19174.1 p24 [Agapanthus tungrovirus]QVY19273.1 p24 [Agapanthus tungrovirus]
MTESPFPYQLYEHRFDYLSLELPEKHKHKNLSLDKCSFNCFFNRSFKHVLHSEDNHLNGITDLLINLGSNLTLNWEKLKSVIEKLILLPGKTTKEVKELSQEFNQVKINFDFLKDQQNLILSRLKGLKNLDKNIAELTIEIQNAKPKQVELKTLQLLEKHDNQLVRFDQEIDKIKEILAKIAYASGI